MMRPFPFPVLLLLLAAVTLASCARSGPPAPVVNGITPSRLPPSASAPSDGLRQGMPGTVTVRRGDTLYGIARANEVPLRAMIEANNLQPPYVLRVGDVLRLPNARFHVVAGGDTLYGIARRYDVDVSSLARANSLSAPFTIRLGQRLVLPSAVQASPATTAVARADDTVPLANTRPAPSAEPAPSTAPSEPQASTEEPRSPPAQSQTAAAPPPASGSSAILKAPPPRSGSTFLMPVNGRILSDFGPRGGGLHNDGINIAAPRGTPVLAAENGVVVYAGSELKGFGNLLLINHAGGYMTAYAHNEALLVRRGDEVRRGQAIARVGRTGSVDTPQLHFEVRRNSRAVDPKPYLQRGVAELPR
ncbi:LysM peptidoglycan-binding domain-containing M23 family metallopeptidase [Oceanibaculum sp.]|uniref:LysM peptidoglycan-binding domain-containing M23 family metallopeptidase n=1 Tax=Oceanibaculum sp. TaxID=1903597 RepID=UPI002583C84D|nr:LysM peptidoglycan-binding domain-containing M23 family metallopeptidase [Oceanibaculum sp.]MCH2395949.1 LysM peptidoglycan-binding domain-containing M23 family metallopeptidase [Oceanibaculum sp.]